MNTVTVSASRSYRVEIGSGLLETLGERAAALTDGRTAALISDDTVAGLYAGTAAAALEQASFRVVTHVFPHGEASKCGSSFLEIQEFLAANRLTRSDLIVALGGGVTGDLAGFCAATYQRGIPFIQVPTTLLSMVDSSVGGKTAIDLPSGKNMCGAFYQPSLVLCDVDTLHTLPADVFADGCAEVIKYGMLGDAALFDTLRAGPAAQDWTEIITRCVDMKREVVEEDEFDTGRRQFLNLGHTLGHAVEKNSDFTLSHGRCVAIGMAMIARAAERRGILPAADRRALEELLQRYDLPVATRQTAEEIFAAAQGDKKRRGAGLTLIVPTAIGCCRLEKTAVDELPTWIAAGL